MSSQLSVCGGAECMVGKKEQLGWGGMEKSGF